MSKRGFSLGDYLKEPGVSELNTGREELRYLPLDLIDPDPCNFYSLEGLDELAGNIELIGLQQPLRVRPTSSVGSADSFPKGEAKAMRYIVVSGHRRRAACLLIRDGGNSMFDKGVPCLIDYGEASDAMRELRLIFANSATRVMSAAEISRQAERVTELLYELSKQGVEFPGRMRDHVAEACRVSSTKLARLHAIRERLVPELLARFDKGEINESVAYRISREAAGIQAALAKAPAIVRGETAEKIGQIIDRLKEPPAGAIHESPADDQDTEDDDEDEGRQIADPAEIRPTWYKGTPPQAGRYYARIDMGDGGTHEAVGEYRGGSWSVFGGPLYENMKVVGWWPLPER